jgi:hypothetical protein
MGWLVVTDLSHRNRVWGYCHSQFHANPKNSIQTITCNAFAIATVKKSDSFDINHRSGVSNPDAVTGTQPPRRRLCTSVGRIP